jgi:RNA polymerase sigma-70 factor, ECF subfamily
MIPSDRDDSSENRNARGTLSDSELELLYSGVRIMARRKLGDSDIIEDVVQETIVRAQTEIDRGRLHDRAKLGAFVRGIAHHVIADTLERRRRTDRLDLNPEASSVSSEKRDVLRMLVDEEEFAELRAALRKLSVEDRELLRLSFDEGLSPMEIATRIDTSAVNVRKRKERALNRLRQVFLALRPGLSRPSV